MAAAAKRTKPAWVGRCWVTLQKGLDAFLEDDVLTLSGALTFYTMLSFAPLILLALWATSALGWGCRKRFWINCNR